MTVCTPLSWLSADEMERMDSLVGREMPKFVTLSWVIVTFTPGDKESRAAGAEDAV